MTDPGFYLAAGVLGGSTLTALALVRDYLRVQSALDDAIATIAWQAENSKSMQEHNAILRRRLLRAVESTQG